ncbi:hypothetical protein C8T65DRAFT_660523 [Cerioporus squamosus]|nr:hypothetical protein C8T65DRAFT_660523 [Cerioporus squamosus]
MPAAPFSRLALAAALIEYDNDKDDPSKPPKSAQDSAIFLPFRNIPIRPERKSTDYLGVSLPSETGDSAPRPASRSSGAFDRKSRASIDALRNPFGRDSTYDAGYEEEEEEEDLEVDLASWGLDALVPKEKEKEKGKEKEKRKRNKSEVLPNPHDMLGRGRPPHMRTMSGNLLNGLGEGGAFLDSQPSADSLGARRHSIGDPLDAPMAYDNNPILPPRARSPSAHALIDNIALSNPLHTVPFPSSETVRSPTPGDDRRRTLSLGSRGMLNNEFRPTSPDRASRLDHGRTYSSGSIGKMLDEPQPDEDNPFALRPPSPSRMSRFDPKAQRARTLSHGTLATQMMLDDEPALRAEAVSRPSMGERRYSRMDLMRPKVLIMPSPLQSAATAPAPPPVRAHEGFELSTDGRPLPPGARAARRASASLSTLEPGGLSAPIASNSFTPNPRASLTLSQLIFRNTLLVDGQRDVAYADIEGRLKRATEDGEQIEPESEPEPEPQPVVHPDEPTGPKRPAGKLYGRSLIDNLEARKAEMRGKQRVFRGDDRPSMMARTQPVRSSTLINPEELKRPGSQHMNSFNSAPNLTRRNSVNAKPLLDFEDEIPGAPRQSLHPGGGGLGAAGTTRSVFGVDTLWERELAKLQVIEEQERQAEEERRKREAEEEAKNKKKGKKKKGKGKEREEQPPNAPTSPAPQTSSPGITESNSAPPVLPAIPKTTVRRAPPPPVDDDDESDDDSDSSDAPVPARAQASGWHSDEDEGPRRTTGTGPRYPNIGGPPRLPQIPGARDDDESSEEDVPLVATIGRAAQRQARSRVGDDDSSDEEKPLIVLLDKTKQKLPSLGGGGSSLSPHSPARAGGGDDDDDDDKPLGLRVSHFGSSLNPSLAGGNEDEDDKPLGLHPEQLRKSQFFMAAQQQQAVQQAQMAQMAAAHQSMVFGAPSMMSSGFFGPPPMAPPMMMYPQLPPTPPPMQDATKFVRVDKWRHDVAVEGERS